MTQLNVGVIIGSIAGPSINRRLANALIKLAPGDEDDGNSDQTSHFL